MESVAQIFFSPPLRIIQWAPGETVEHLLKSCWWESLPTDEPSPWPQRPIMGLQHLPVVWVNQVFTLVKEASGPTTRWILKLTNIYDLRCIPLKSWCFLSVFRFVTMFHYKTATGPKDRRFHMAPQELHGWDLTTRIVLKQRWITNHRQKISRTKQK